MEAVYLKSQGLLHQDICRLARISENTLRSSLRQFQEGGLERLKRTQLAEHGQRTGRASRDLEDYFRNNPPRSTAQAAADIERITGVRRGLTQVREFLKGMGLKYRKLGMIPAKADADEQGEFLDEKLWPRLRQAQWLRRVVCFVDAAHFVHGPYLGYLWCFVAAPDAWPLGPQAVPCPGGDRRGHPRVDDGLQRHGDQREAVCELLRKLSARYAGLPMTLVLDNARYQRCDVVQQLAQELGIELLFLPVGFAEPEPDRAAVEVRQEGVPVLPVRRGLRPVQGGDHGVPGGG